MLTANAAIFTWATCEETQHKHSSVLSFVIIYRQESKYYKLVFCALAKIVVIVQPSVIECFAVVVSEVSDVQYRLGLCCAPVTIMLVTRLSAQQQGLLWLLLHCCSKWLSQLLVLNIKTFILNKKMLFLKLYYLYFLTFLLVCLTSSVCTISLWNSTWDGPFKTPW